METVDVSIIRVKSYMRFLITYVVGGSLLTSFLAIQLKEMVIGWLGLFTFICLPGVFLQKFQRRFLQPATFSFSDHDLSVNTFDSDGQIDQTANIKYDRIKNFRVMESSKDDSAFVKIYMKDGGSYKYTLTGQERGNTDFLISDLLFSYINKYNKAVLDESARITFVPNLFATAQGKWLIFGLSSLMFIGLIIQIKYVPTTIPGLLFTAVVFYLIIILQKRKDVEMLKRMH